MKQYEAVIFDLDGTLADTGLGIRNGYVHALTKMDIPVPPAQELEKAIGAPLLQVFLEMYGLELAEAKKAVAFYREVYNTTGMYEAEPYEGIVRVLELLRAGGFKLGVATLKAENAAHSVLNHLKLADYFDTICGMSLQREQTKAELIRQCLDGLGVQPRDALMVGDSAFDAIGAREAGVDFAAALYGFGFHETADAAEYTPALIINTPVQLLPFLTGRELDGSSDTQ